MPQAKNRFLFDTNAYGLLCEQDDLADLLYKIHRAGIIIAGSRIVRKELRDISKKIMLKGTKLRARALQVYDTLVLEKRDYSATGLVESLAKDYYLAYNGRENWKELETDFQIVAIASIHQLPAIVTNDLRTMASEDAIKAYRQVNQRYELMTPKFIRLEEFLGLLK